MLTPEQIATDREAAVKLALEEDIGSGDITAMLVPAVETARATIITREKAVIAGKAWVDEVFHQLAGDEVTVEWHCNDGELVDADAALFSLEGCARHLLTGERTALNFLQLLSGVATRCHHYASLVQGTHTRILDTRKTIPGLRTAQKYAVTQGGCHNHRIGLYDAFLIKENHIVACGGIPQAIANAHQIAPGKPVEVEVESIAELTLALEANADIVMLDNFPIPQLEAAVALNREQFAGKAKLEASGGITESALRPIAETGVDYISIGALTKDCKAIDLSMRFNR